MSCKISLNGKKRRHIYSISRMGYESIKPFVEELRSNGVKVECEPYRLDGKMIYL